jgi:hypothetical protein
VEIVCLRGDDVRRRRGDVGAVVRRRARGDAHEEREVVAHGAVESIRHASRRGPRFAGFVTGARRVTMGRPLRG